MKESGVRALKERRKEASEEEIEREVRLIIEEYRDNTGPVLSYFSEKGTLAQVKVVGGD